MTLHSAESRRPARKHRLRVIRPEVLANEVRALITLHGSQSAVARKTGIQQSQLSRLANGRLKHLGLDQFRRLAMSLTIDAHSRLQHALFSADAATAVKAYGQWVTAKTDLIRRPVGSHWTTQRGRLRQAKRTVAQDERCANLDALNSHIRQRFPDLYNQFLRKVDRLQVGRDRCWLALLRTLEPLVEDGASGFIERSWTELSDAELRVFIDAGLKRETILLTREADFQRAQRVATIA